MKQVRKNPSTFAITMNVNGTRYESETKPSVLLVDYLRDVLGLTGTHIGCDTSNCGACTVVLNGRSVKSCTVLAVQADESSVTTIEGLSEGDTLHPLQESFIKHHALQCGYCTPGMIMSAYALLMTNPDPSEGDVRTGLSGNLCRCTGYKNIVQAVLAASRFKSSPPRKSNL